MPGRMTSLCFAVVLFSGLASPWGSPDTRAAELVQPAQGERVAKGGADQAGGAGRIEITSAERVSVRFQGYPELTGEYRINPDDTISVPVLGRIPVSGMTSLQVERLLQRRVTEMTGRETFVTVEITAYRPLFVTGAVRNSGAIQWQPGMTVLQAVALVGGLQRSDAPAGNRTAGPSDADLMRMRKSSDNLKRTLALLARLKAERDSAASLSVPPDLISLVGRKEAEELVAAQTALFTSRRESQSAQIATLHRGMALASRELQGLTAQKARLEEQLRWRADSRQKIQELAAKGVVTRERGIEEDIKVSEVEEKSVTNAVGTARVQGTLAGLQREMVLLQQERQAGIQTEVSNAERDIAQLKIELEVSRDAVLKEGGDDLVGGIETSFTIVRKDGPNSRSITADAGTTLRQDDILIVAQSIRSANAGADKVGVPTR